MTLEDGLPQGPPRTFLDGVKAYWPYITACTVAAWFAFTWLTDQRKVADDRRAETEKQTQVRLFEAQKPFRDKQFELYVETAKVVGKLVSSPDLAAKEWEESFKRYEQLYWAELSLVEDE